MLYKIRLVSSFYYTLFQYYIIHSIFYTFEVLFVFVADELCGRRTLWTCAKKNVFFCDKSKKREDPEFVCHPTPMVLTRKRFPRLWLQYSGVRVLKRLGAAGTWLVSDSNPRQPLSTP